MIWVIYSALCQANLDMHCARDGEWIVFVYILLLFGSVGQPIFSLESVYLYDIPLWLYFMYMYL